MYGVSNRATEPEEQNFFLSVLMNHLLPWSHQMPHRMFPLRLSPSMREQVEHLAKRDQISINHFIALAVAEKLSRMEHTAWMGMNVPPAPQRPLTSTNFAS